MLLRHEEKKETKLARENASRVKDFHLSHDMAEDKETWQNIQKGRQEGIKG